MRAVRCLVACSILLFLPATLGVSGESTESKLEPSFRAQAAPIAGRSPRNPLGFTQNLGQWDDRVLFLTRSGGATIWITRDGLVYRFTRPLAQDASSQRLDRGSLEAAASATGSANRHKEPGPVEQLLVKATFAGANAAPRAAGLQELNHNTGYFLGNDPGKWRSNVPTYASVVLEEVYPGIDARFDFDGNGQALCTWVARPGVDLSRVGMQYEDVASGSVLKSDHSLIHTAWGHTLASVGEAVSGRPIVVSPLREADRMGSFDVAISGASSSDPNTLGLSYSTFLGGGADDQPNGIAVGNDTCAYVISKTESSNFPLVAPSDGTKDGFDDATVTKFGPDGSVIYSTYLGGSGGEWGQAIAVDGDGSAYVTGLTASSDFPVPGGNQTLQGSVWDAFVAKLSWDGVALSLTYGTFLGGDADDVAYAIAVDGDGSAYVTGRTNSSDWPLDNELHVDSVGMDAFITKLDWNGSTLDYGYSTYLGGASDDRGWGIAVDDQERAYVTGETHSPGFPRGLAFSDPHLGNNDVFITRFNAAGDGLEYTRLLGTVMFEAGNAIAVDRNYNAYVAGQTTTNGFPTTSGAYDTTWNGNEDAFVVKLAANGNLVFGTFLGSGASEWGYGIAVDRKGNALVVGETYSTDFPTVDAFQGDSGTIDIFVAMFNAAGSHLRYCTYLGGGSEDYARGAALDYYGRAHVTGHTWSSGFPTENAAYPSGAGLRDGVVTRFTCNQDTDGDAVCDDADNCPYVPNLPQADGNTNGIGTACEVPHALVISGHCPIDLVVTDPNGDSIGIGFNTIGLGAVCDTTQDFDSPDLSGPDGELDDRITIPVPVAGPYAIRIVREPGAADNDKFTLTIRIDGNQQLVPEGYQDVAVSSIGTPGTPETYVWVAALTLTGDLNHSGTYTSADVIQLVNYVFKGAAAPDPVSLGDVNCSGDPTSADIIALVNHVFKSGLPPCSGSAD